MEDNLLEYQKLKDELEQVCLYVTGLPAARSGAAAGRHPAPCTRRARACTPTRTLALAHALACADSHATDARAARCESCVACFRVARVQVFVDVVGLNEALDASDGESDLSDSDHSDEEVRIPTMGYYLVLEGHSRCSSGTKGYSGVPSASESESESDISESGRSDEEADPYPYPLPFQYPQYCSVLPQVPPDPKHKHNGPVTAHPSRTAGPSHRSVVLFSGAAGRRCALAADPRAGEEVVTPLWLTGWQTTPAWDTLVGQACRGMPWRTGGRAAWASKRHGHSQGS
jgi:hypothetical protein